MVGEYRVQCVATRSSVVAQDVAVIDFGFIHGAFGTSAAAAAIGLFTADLAGLAAPIPGDITSLFDAFETFLADVANNYQANTLTWDIVKLYEVGPGHPEPNAPIATRDVNFNGSGLHSAPPQVSTTCTLETGSRRHWGRIYLPSLQREQIKDNGRVADGLVTGLPDKVKTLMDTVQGAAWYPVVFQKAGADVTGAGRTVIAYKSDDLVDIQRRRRWEHKQLTHRVAI